MYTLKRKGMEDCLYPYEGINRACMIYRKRNNRDITQLFFVCWSAAVILIC